MPHGSIDMCQKYAFGGLWLGGNRPSLLLSQRVRCQLETNHVLSADMQTGSTGGANPRPQHEHDLQAERQSRHPPGETRISAKPLILAAMIKLCLTAPHLFAPPEVRVFDAGKGAGRLLGKILFLAEGRLTHVAPQAKNRKPVHTFPCLDR